MAKILVKMYATVREAAQTSEIWIDASDVRNALDLLRVKLGRAFSELLDRAEADPDNLVILINGMVLPWERAKESSLSDGDEVSIFPPVSGG